jgi:DNA-directed RNA polymerase sigma subunit (sigma70/sigma32)
LVDFPTREKFDAMFERKNMDRDKYWIVVNLRAEGKTLKEIADQLNLTKERVRQIEAKFCKKVAFSLKLGLL